jgi:diguanylate cyclase (GGDEF)-like protein
MTGTYYHLQSLTLAMVFVSCVAFLCVAPAMLRLAEGLRGSMRSWVIGTALVVSADVLFSLGIEVEHFTALLIAISGTGAAEWIHSLRLYNGSARRATWPYVLIAAGAGFAFAFPSYPTTVLVTCLLYGVLYVAAAFHAAKLKTPERSAGRILLMTVFLVVAIVMTARLSLFFSGLRSGAPQGFTTPVRALMFIVASIAPMAASFAFVVACGEVLGDRLLRWSLTDSLTGIPNRRSFLDTLTRALSSGTRRAEPVGVLVIDVDHFKRINDTAGHATGDLVLSAIARLLTDAARSEDTVARLGGEEFGVVVPGADLATAASVAERLRSKIAATPIPVDGKFYELTVSIGVAAATEAEHDAGILLNRADTLLYEAKGSGRDRVIAR